MRHFLLAVAALLVPAVAFGQAKQPTGASASLVTATGSTTARTLATRAAEVYNVLDNGVVCDGTTNGVGTDNVLALKALLLRASANATSAHHVAIYFPPVTGACLIGATIYPYNYEDLIAAPGTAVLAPTAAWAAGNNSTTPADALLMGIENGAVGTDNVIQGLTFDGGENYSPAPTNVARNILVYQASGLLFEKNTVRNTRGRAIELSGYGSNYKFKDNQFFNIGNYWKTSHSQFDRYEAFASDEGPTQANAALLTDIEISGNYLNDIGLDPIRVTARGVRIIGNEINNNTMAAQGALIAVNPDGISGSGSNWTVSSNLVRGAVGMCIAVAGNNLTITANSCDTSGNSSILLQGSSIIAANNVLSNPVSIAPFFGGQPNYNACVTIQGESTNVDVSNNTCVDMHTQYASVTSGQAAITNLGETTLFAVGDPIVGTAFPAGTTVLSVDSQSQITASANATMTNTGALLTIGTPTMQYGFEGVTGNGSPGSANGNLANINIQQNNTVRGAATAVFEPPALVHAYDVALGFGMNYPTAGASSFIPLIAPQGRLTLTSGAAVQTADVTAVGTIYYDPYAGTNVPVYNGAVVQSFVIPNGELSLILDTTHHLSGSVYDVFGINNGGSLLICAGPAWSSISTRGTGAGTTQIHNSVTGYWTNAASLSHCYNNNIDYGAVAVDQGTYLGSLYATANGQTSEQFAPAAATGGSNAFLGLFNAYNRVAVTSRSQDSTATWTYSSSTWRPADGSNSNRITWLDGLGQSAATASYLDLAIMSSAAFVVGIDINSTSASPSSAFEAPQSTGGISAMAKINVPPTLGLSYAQAMEAAVSGGAATFYGYLSTAPARQFMSLTLETSH